MKYFITTDEKRRINKYIGESIEYFRKEKRISLEKIQREISISRKHLWELRKGKQSITITKLVTIALRLDVDPRKIVGHLMEDIFEHKLPDEEIEALFMEKRDEIDGSLSEDQMTK